MSRLDAHNRLQIDELGGRPGPVLVTMLANTGPKAIRARQRVPGLVRRQHIGRMYPEEPLADDRLGYMLDVLGLRDPWMHRIDLSRATGRPVQLGGHDREIVGQVVRDLGRAWEGPALHLELTGPAGGSWLMGDGAPAASIQVDTIDYLRSLSGRAEHPDLRANGDPAAIAAATAARVVF